ncbi:MAG TPA: hypothetical protein VMD25_08400 [Acidobacteriaceae bacterium]|nr:hypothetical protein [Acidobacteriaceae bacterium]
MRQLRDTRQIERWLESGETLRLRKRNRPLAQITPIDKPKSEEKHWPDFEARLKKIFGNRVLNVVDEYIEDRNRW